MNYREAIKALNEAAYAALRAANKAHHHDDAECRGARQIVRLSDLLVDALPEQKGGDA